MFTVNFKMTETEVIYNKLYNEDKTRLFRIKTEWNENLFKLCVVEGMTAWSASVTKEHIDMLAAQHEIDCDTYYSKVKEYICRNQSGVTFDIAKKQFFIYRNLKKGRMKFFFVNLEQLIYQETMEILFDELSAGYTNALEGLQVLEKHKLEAESQKLLFEKKLQQFTELKHKSDLQMCSAFLLLLNEKKHRIRFLTEALEGHKGGTKRKINETATSSKQLKGNSKPAAKEAQKAAATSREEISDSDSNTSDGYNTDEEKKAKAVKEVTAIPGTSKDNFDFLGGDSPPPKLPKRVKKEVKDKCQVSSSIKDVDKQIQKNGVKQQPVDTKAEESDEEPQSLEFNTQELLDRM